MDLIEVEVKLKVNSAEEIATRLTENGYNESRYLRETDVYFNGADRDFRMTDEALRIRKVESLDNLPLIADATPDEPLVKVTYKGPKFDKVSMTRKEIETTVNDFDEMKSILEVLGYKAVRPVVKTRKEFLSEYVAACVDDVEGLGTYLELEVMVEGEDDRTEALELIEKELGKLGYSMKDTITTSYLSMIEKKAD